jgi:hypothetical protein
MAEVQGSEAVSQLGVDNYVLDIILDLKKSLIDFLRVIV